MSATSNVESDGVVLLVEDEPLLMTILVEMVEDAGFTPLEAVDAPEALETLQARPDIRIMLTDIELPGGIDGLKLAAAVRRRWPSVEIVVASGRQLPSRAELPARSVFMAKPLSCRDLSDTLHRLAA